MTVSQATDFTSRYTIVSHLPNTASGFSATLMQDNVTGAYTLSMRSTEYFNEDQGGDWARDGLTSGADREIARYGFAFGQIASMESYYDHLKRGESYNTGTGQWESDATLNDFKIRFGGSQVSGTLNVTGYSLSGSLAYAFKLLHPEVIQAVVFNSTGMGTVAAGSVQAMVGDLRQQLTAAGIDLSVPSSDNIYAVRAPSDILLKARYQIIVTYLHAAYGTGYSQSGNVVSMSNVTQLFGHGVHNDDEIVANAGNHVQPTMIFIEDQPNIQGLGLIPTTWVQSLGISHSDFGTTHSITLLADSLAVMSVFERLGLDMSTPAGLTAAYNLLAAGSNQLATGVLGGNGTAESDSLEKPVEALGRLFLGKDAFAALVGGEELPRGTQGGSFGDLVNRGKFYVALDAINAAITDLQAMGETYTIRRMGLDAAADAAAAQTDIAVRYALKELIPFAVQGRSYDSYAQALSLYDSATGTGTLTPEWITDRAAMLAWMVKLNTEEAIASASKPYAELGAPTSYFEDRTTGGKIHLGQPDWGNVNRRQYIFGQDQTDGKTETLTGGSKSDRLYGGAGNDILNGGAENDYLEGGTGDDMLRGGLGNDTYRIDKNSGTDTIVDYAREGLFNLNHSGGDGQGSTVYNGTDLTGTLTQDTTDRALYRSDKNGDVRIRFSGVSGERGLLIITDPTGATIKIQNWKTSELGLILAASTDGRSFTTLHGTEDGDNANLADPHGAPLTASTFNQEIWGHGGSDQIYLPFAGDIAYGGSGNDVIRNGAGDQALHGEDGNDILIGSSGNDILDGGIGDDALQGGADDDVLDGGDGMDLLDGGQGSDVIKGGAGDDFILGGGNLTVLLTTAAGSNDYNHLADGSLEMLHLDANGKLSLPSLTGISPTNANAYEIGYSNIEGDGADVIDAGSGNDWVFAGDGDDLVQGGNGADYMVGQAGNDFIEGGADDDILYGDGVEGDLFQAPGSLSVYTLPAFQGDDYIDGGDGNDFISGDGGADEVFGGAGNDILIGDSSRLDAQYHGADYLDGEDGNDTLYGYGKDDSLFGGAGDDVLEGDSSSVAASDHGDDYLDGEDGNDTLKGDGGNDTLFGGTGNDQLFGDTDDTPVANQGADYLDGEDGDDNLRGYAGNDTLIGGEGADQLLGEAGDDNLDGGAGDDILVAGADNDTLTGGAGTDYLDGGLGDDTYILKVGDGATATDGTTEAIVDGGGMDTLRFDTGITLAGIVTSRANANDLLLDMGADRLVIAQGWGGAVERFEFADGTRYSFSQLVGRTLRSPQVQIATTPDATLLGGSGSDTLTASGGRARVSGGQGNDVLRVLGTDNTILYAKGDGTDQVVSDGAGNVLRLSGVTAADLKLGLGSLAIQIGDDANDVIHFEDFDPADVFAQRPFEHIEFDDGTGIGQDTVIEAVGESSEIRLDPGIGFANLKTQVSGADAVQSIRNSGDTLHWQPRIVQESRRWRYGDFACANGEWRITA